MNIEGTDLIDGERKYCCKALIWPAGSTRPAGSVAGKSQEERMMKKAMENTMNSLFGHFLTRRFPDEKVESECSINVIDDRQKKLGTFAAS